MKNSRYFIFLTPVAVLLIFEFFVFKPDWLYWTFFAANALVLLTIFMLTRNTAPKWYWLNYAILPILFTTSLVGYATFLANKFVIELLLVSNSFFLFIHFRQIYLYLRDFNAGKIYTLENVSAYGNFLVIFFSTSIIFGLQSFLNAPVWLLITSILPVYFLVLYHVFLNNNFNIKKSLVYIFIAELILVEITWSISFLPLSFGIAGLILAICYYVLIGLIRFYLKNSLNKNIIKLYLALALSCIAIILLTSRWL